MDADYTEEATLTFDNVKGLKGLSAVFSLPSVRTAVPKAKKRTVLLLLDEKLYPDAQDEGDSRLPPDACCGEVPLETIKNIIGVTCAGKRPFRERFRKSPDKNTDIKVPLKFIVGIIPAYEYQGASRLHKMLVEVITANSVDTVVIASPRHAYLLYSQDVFRRNLNRLHPLILHGGKTVDAILTCPAVGWTHPKPKLKGEDGGDVAAIGIVADDIETAVRGVNRYNIGRYLPKDAPPKYTFIKTKAEFDSFYKKLLACETPVFDTEGHGIGRVSNTLLTFQWCLPTDMMTDNKPPLYGLALDHRETPFSPKMLAYIKKKLVAYFEGTVPSKTKFIIIHNASFDIGQVLGTLKARWFAHDTFDTLTGAHALMENAKFLPRVYVDKPFQLDALEERYGYVRPNINVTKSDRRNLKDKPLKDVLDYGIIDAITPLLMMRCMLAEARRQGYGSEYLRLITKQISATSRSVARMEVQGLAVDVPYLHELQKPGSDFNKAIAEAASKFRDFDSAKEVNLEVAKAHGYQARGLFSANVEPPWLFDIAKADHKKRLYVDKLKLSPIPTSEKTGQPSFGKAFVAIHKRGVPEVAAQAAYVGLKTLKSSFVDSFVKRMDSDPDARQDAHIRSSYSQHTVTSGRLSSTGPNLQNTPTRGKIAKIIKHMFVSHVDRKGVPVKGKTLVKADMSAHEIRKLGNISRDPAIQALFLTAKNAKLMLRLAKAGPELDAARLAFKKEGDIHIINVKVLYGLDIDSSHPLRGGVKQTVFGLAYGKQAPALAKDLRQGQREDALDMRDKLLLEKKALLAA